MSHKNFWYVFMCVCVSMNKSWVEDYCRHEWMSQRTPQQLVASFSIFFFSPNEFDEFSLLKLPKKQSGDDATD